MTTYLVISTISLVLWLVVIVHHGICTFNFRKKYSYILKYLDSVEPDLKKEHLSLIVLREKIDRELARIEDE